MVRQRGRRGAGIRRDDARRAGLAAAAAGRSAGAAPPRGAGRGRARRAGRPGGGSGGSFEEPALVLLSAPVPLARVVSGHVDGLAAVADVGEAAAALPAADAGDDDARFLVDGAEGHELMWYATQELSYLAE